MSALNVKDDDEEELGAYIYQTSHTAKLFREKALVLASSSHQTQRKSPRLLATKSKQQDIHTPVVPEKSISNTNITTKERSKRKRESAVVKEELCTTPIRPKSSRKQSQGGRYACGTKKYYCRHEGCTNVRIQGGVCIRHGAKKKRYECSHKGCTNGVVQGGVCVRHGAIIKRCSYDGCSKKVQSGGVCIRHGAKVKLCNHEGCNNQAQKGGVCLRHGAKVKTCKHKGCNNQVKKGGVCIRHGAKTIGANNSDSGRGRIDIEYQRGRSKIAKAQIK